MVVGVGVTFIVFIFAMALAASAFSGFSPGEPTEPTEWGIGSLGSSCNIPSDYLAVFNNAVKKSDGTSYKVSPALLAATFYAGEHGSSWPNIAGPWASSPVGASGPFQFMPCTWDGNKAPGCSREELAKTNGSQLNVPFLTDQAAILSYNGLGRDSDGGGADVQNINDAAASAAALYEANMASQSGDETTKIRKAIYLYNHDNSYVDKVFSQYQIFKSCSEYGAGVPTDITIEGFDRTYENQEPLRSFWSGRQKFIPKGITLHWTGGPYEEGESNAHYVERMIQTWHNNGNVFNHLVIDPEGKVYEMLPLNIKQAGSGYGISNTKNANIFTIGIEIVGSSKDQLLNNGKQKSAVIATVKQLIEKFNIPNLKGNADNLNNEKGIFGHFQVAGKGPENLAFVPGCYSQRREDPGIKYLEQIWDAVGSTGIGCVGTSASNITYYTGKNP